MEPLLMNNNNLTGAWCDVLEHFCNHSGLDISPLVMSLTDFDESPEVRTVIEQSLRASGLPGITTVAETIFPQSLYMMCEFDRKELYAQYMKNYPRIRRIDAGNNRGTYFQRLIAYQAGDKEVNQLEVIINSLLDTKVKRRSKLQASIFDPGKDHTTGMFQKFPCLQHVTFYKSEKGGLVLNSFYAVQHFYRRAYGNWLGLIYLGKFIAQETGLNFERMNCFIGVEHLDEITKTEASKLLAEIDVACS